jgi:hypothetical protein
MKPEIVYANILGRTMRCEVVKTMKPLEDTDPMPFGKYKGTMMQDVPAHYLHWLWTNGKQSDKQCAVADYIRRNLSALKQENPDAIWS